MDAVYWKSSSTAKQAGASLATQELINQWRLLPFLAAEIIDNPVAGRWVAYRHVDKCVTQTMY
jgi:hypothetical protein